MLCDQKIYFMHFQSFKDLFQSSNSCPFILKYHSGQMALLLKNSEHIGEPDVIKYKQFYMSLIKCSEIALSSLSFLLCLQNTEKSGSRAAMSEILVPFSRFQREMSRQPAPVSLKLALLSLAHQRLVEEEANITDEMLHSTGHFSKMLPDCKRLKQ